MHFIKYWLPSVAMAVLIFTGSSLSFEKVPMPEVWNFDKFIHVIEYGIFALLLFRSYSNSKNNFLIRNAGLLAAVTASLYGAFDELHQYFVPNRQSSFLDLCADTVGAVAAVLILKLLLRGRKNA